MTILNCYVDQRRALVASDTRSIVAGSEPVHVQKLFPLPHLNAVIAFRGSCLFFICAYSAIWGATPEPSDLAAQAPSLLQKAYQEALIIAEKRGLTDVDHLHGSQEMMLAGWPKMNPAPFACLYANRPSQTEFMAERIELGGDYKAPIDLDGSFGAGNMPCSTVEEMVQLALVQKALMERYYPGHAAVPGGNLIVAEIRGGGMTIATACDLDLPASDAKWKT